MFEAVRDGDSSGREVEAVNWSWVYFCFAWLHRIFFSSLFFLYPNVVWDA